MVEQAEKTTKLSMTDVAYVIDLFLCSHYVSGPHHFAWVRSNSLASTTLNSPLHRVVFLSGKLGLLTTVPLVP